MGNRILLLPIIGVSAFFILLLLFTKLIGPIPFSINSVVTQKSDVFTVSGEGEVSTSPDIAYLTVGISANTPTAKAARDQINSIINEVSKAIKNLGVSEKDIQTQNYSIHPNMDYSGNTQRITGYSANTNLFIKIRELENINSVIDASVASGANQVGGVSFDVDDRLKAENEAREKAVLDAKKKAEAAAKIAGFRLGKLINYQEGTPNIYSPVARAMALPQAGGGDSVTQVEPGSTQIKITVTLSYEIL